MLQGSPTCGGSFRQKIHLGLNDLYVWFRFPFLSQFFHPNLNINMVFGEKKTTKITIFSDFEALFCVK